MKKGSSFDNPIRVGRGNRCELFCIDYLEQNGDDTGSAQMYVGAHGATAESRKRSLDDFIKLNFEAGQFTSVKPVLPDKTLTPNLYH